MSASVEYFFNCDLDFEQLAAKINEWLGCHFAPIESRPTLCHAWFLGLNWYLKKNSISISDRELNFCDYAYCLGIDKLWSNGTELLALVAWELRRGLAINEGMLVYDLQVLLARYNLLGNQWFDAVSGKVVSSYAVHLVDIDALLFE